MITTDEIITASSGPAIAEISSSGRANPSPHNKVRRNTPRRALMEPPTTMTMRKGQMMLRGKSCKLM